MKLKGLPSLVAGLVTSGLVGLVLAASQEPVAVQAVPLPQTTITEAERGETNARGVERQAVSPTVTPSSSTSTSAAAQTSSAVAAAAQPTVTASAGEESALMVMPVSGAALTSPFGPRLHPITGTWKMHTGQDWAAGCGTPVGAAAAGTVTFAGWAGGYGMQVKVSHGKLGGYDVVTTYNHLSAIAVSVGQSVAPLQGVGLMGTTGSSTGCHLHFEVLANGNFTDPMKWINGKSGSIDLSQAKKVTPQNPSPDSGGSSNSSPSSSPSSSQPSNPTPSKAPSKKPSSSVKQPSTSPSQSQSTAPKPKPSAAPSSSKPAPSSPAPSSVPSSPPSQETPTQEPSGGGSPQP